jgi:alpha-glucan,water dikinase
VHTSTQLKASHLPLFCCCCCYKTSSFFSGADLQASAANVGNSLPGGARGYLGYVTTHINTPQILPFLEAAVEARTEISHALVGNRDLLYLDVALENSIRGAAERGVGSAGGQNCVVVNSSTA